MGKVIGLTGNMACGKSVVARFLRELGVPVIDADDVSRDVSRAGSATLKKIASVFGPKVLDAKGELDRRALRDIVFHNEQSRKKLESILHPAIQTRSRELFEEQFKDGHDLVVYEASLLVEAGREKDLDGLLVVTCPPDAQKERALARDKTLTAELVQKMIDAQMPQVEKIRRATWVIENTGSLEALRKQVKTWLAQVKTL